MHGSFDQPGNAARQRKRAEAASTPTESQMLSLTFSEADCSRIQPLLEAFHDGALGELDHRLVREHVARCGRCAAQLSRYEEIDALLWSAPAPRVGPELRTQLYTRIGAAQQRHSIFAMFGAGRQQKMDEHTSDSWGSANRRVEARRGFGGSGPRLVANWINGVAALAVVLLLVLLFHTLTDMPYRMKMSSTIRGKEHLIATLSGLPKFSEYRAAYLDFEGHLRIAASDRRVYTGPALPNAGLLMRTPAAPYYDVTASQDGHYLAYIEGDASVRDAETPLPDGGPVAIVNLLTGAVLSMPVVANDLSWSPDNRLLAAPDVNNAEAINIIDATAGVVRQLRGSFDGLPAFVPLVAGWIDSMHVAVFYQWGSSSPTLALATPTVSQPAGSVQQSLGSMDIRSGVITYLVDLPDPSDVFLSPDGEKVLLAPNYSTKVARVVDTRTRQIRELTAISQAFEGKFAALGPGGNWAMHSAWQPGSGHVLALSLAINSDSTGQDPGIWLLNLDSNSATRIPGNAYPLAWLPYPTEALLTCDPPQPDGTGVYPTGGAGVGSKLYTFAPVLLGGEALPLAPSMASFLGLVRTM